MPNKRYFLYFGSRNKKFAKPLKTAGWANKKFLHKQVMRNLNHLSIIWATPEFLEAVRLCMNYGYIRASDIIACADKMITTTNNPDKIIIDLSLAHNKEAREIDYIINSFVGDQKPICSARILLSLLNQQFVLKELTTKEIAARLYKYSFDLELSEKDLFYPFDYRYYSAESGISDNIEYITEGIRDLLSIYHDYQLDNYPEWDKIHLTVNGELNNYSNKTRLRITPD